MRYWSCLLTRLPYPPPPPLSRPIRTSPPENIFGALPEQTHHIRCKESCNRTGEAPVPPAPARAPRTAAPLFLQPNQPVELRARAHERLLQRPDLIRCGKRLARIRPPHPRRRPQPPDPPNACRPPYPHAPPPPNPHRPLPRIPPPPPSPPPPLPPPSRRPLIALDTHFTNPNH